MNGIHRLNIIVAINQNGFLGRIPLRAGQNDRMPGSGMQLRMQIHRSKIIGQPCGTLPHGLFMLRISGNAREPEQGKKIVQVK